MRNRKRSSLYPRLRYHVLQILIYYCALCGGWAAFIVWAIQEFTNEFSTSTVP